MSKRLADKASFTASETCSKCKKPIEENEEVSPELKSSSRLGSDFYKQPCVSVAKNLLGKILVRKIEGNETLTARIVETEAYVGTEDKASHSYKGKKTQRNAAMFMQPGTSYVYNIYGMYQCFNVSSGCDGSAVLIRAAEPIFGLTKMEQGRQKKNATAHKAIKNKDLCNGPSKLCQALSITKSLDQVDLTSNTELYLEDDGLKIREEEIVSRPRIGIAYAEEWTDKPLRFYIRDSQFISVK